MTAHQKAWRLRAGLVVALVAAVVGVAVPTAAFAAVTAVSASPSSLDLQPGDSKPVTVKVTGDAAGPANGSFALSGLGSDVTLSGTGCSNTSCTLNVSLVADGDHFSGTATVTVTAKSSVSVAAGGTASGTGAATFGGSSDNVSVTLHGPAAQASTAVDTISGTVKDSATGKGISGAQVILQDQNTKQFTTKTGIAGTYSFKSTPSSQIAAGLLGIVAQMDGYTYDAHPLTVGAGQSATFDIVMVSTASPTASASGPAIVVPTDSAASANPGVVAADAATGGSGNHYLTFMIIAGAVLIVAGIGAIVTLLLRRRNEDDDEDEDDEPAPPRRGPPPGRAGNNPGGYRADPTVVARDPGYNDRTAVVRPVEDEYPDPYAAPPPRSPAPGYGAGQYGPRDGQRAGYGGGAPGGAVRRAGYRVRPADHLHAGRPPARRPVRHRQRLQPRLPLRRADLLLPAVQPASAAAALRQRPVRRRPVGWRPVRRSPVGWRPVRWWL